MPRWQRGAGLRWLEVWRRRLTTRLGDVRRNKARHRLLDFRFPPAFLNLRPRSTAMWAVFRIHAAVGQAQPFHRPSAYQVFRYNFFGILGPDVAVPDGLRVNHHGRSVFALV
jgi:hypothetical protein